MRDRFERARRDTRLGFLPIRNLDAGGCTLVSAEAGRLNAESTANASKDR